MALNAPYTIRFRSYTALQSFSGHGHRYKLEYAARDRILVSVDGPFLEYRIGLNKTNGKVGCVLDLDELSPDTDAHGPLIESLQAHGVIRNASTSSSGHLGRLPQQLGLDAGAPQRYSYLLAPFLLLPPSNMQPQNQAELPYASRVIHLFNLYTGESALSPISNVQLFPNCQYMGKTPITGYKSQIVAFAPRQMVTVTKIEPRMIRIGRNDRIVTLYCTNPSTGVGAWVTESYLRPLEPDVQEISAWSVGTIAEKRHEKVNDNSMECSDDGSGEESDDSEFDSDNIMIYYSCPPSVPEEPNSSSSAPLQVKQEVLPSGQGLRSRISISSNQPHAQTSSYERQVQRDQASARRAVPQPIGTQTQVEHERMRIRCRIPIGPAVLGTSLDLWEVTTREHSCEVRGFSSSDGCQSAQQYDEHSDGLEEYEVDGDE